MEKGQSEVTSKIRSAIKEKLAEISEFVDDELPEYIMILVANQRSKAQIEKDLSLFLRNDAVNFTNWLWQLLSNLKVGSKSNQSPHPQNEGGIPKKKENEVDEDAVVLDCDPDERENDFLSHEDTNDSTDSLVLCNLTEKSTEVKKDDISVTKSRQNYKIIEKDKKQPRFTEKFYRTSPKQSSKEPLPSAVIPMKRRMINSDDEYDPAKPEFVSNSHHSSPRKYCGPAALQANKLLQKAVDDATKSILEGKNIEDYYKPTPIKVLTSKRYGDFSQRREDNVFRKKVTQYEILREPDLNSDTSETYALNYDECADDIFMEENYGNHSAASQRNRTICLRTIPLISNSPELGKRNFSPERTSHYSHSPVEEVRPKSPHFIVTLEGVNLSSLKRKLDDDSIDSMEEDEDENMLTDDIVNDMSPEKKVKLNERCKYWPACKNSDYCPYHHPTIPCKSFPDCKFGDKCLYIHPNCKFDALCSRKDCPFTHASKRKLPLGPLPVRMIPVKSRKVKTVCKFYPKCTSKNCPFIHPKLCRYGTECRLPVCLYSHFRVPARSQMKWQASVS